MGCGVVSRAPAKITVLEDNSVETVSVPSKVGRQIEKAKVPSPSFLSRPRRGHKYRQGSRKVLCQRRLSNLEERVGDFNDGIISLENLRRPSSLTQDEKRLIINVLQKHFLFAPLQPDEHDVVLEQMVRIEREQGAACVTKGEKGDACYIVLSGICSVQSDNSMSVAQLSAGSTFGELAMLYEVPRTATIVCASSRVVLCMIRGACFRGCLACVKERCLNQTMGFLNEHRVFSKLTLQEKRTLASALSPQAFEPGALLIDENLSSSAEWIFLLQEGKVEVTDQYKNRKVLREGAIISCQRMLYGEKAVLATALSRVRCLAIGRSVIDRLFGNIGEVLRRSTMRAFLEPTAAFRELTERQKASVASLFQDEHVRRGEVIVTVLADPQLVIVMDGEVAVVDGLVKSWESESPRTTSRTMSQSTCDVSSDQITHGNFDSAVFGSTSSLRTGGTAKRSRTGSTSSGSIVMSLRRGDVFGEENFCENSSMEKSLVAMTDAVVCRAGYDEVCFALKGSAEKTPPFSLIIERNRIKATLQAIFPFSVLCETMLDMAVDAFETMEYQPGGMILKRDDPHCCFCLVLQGEAVMRRGGELVESLGRWAHMGVQQLLLRAPLDVEVAAAATGCVVMSLKHEKFAAICGPFFNELAMKIKYQDVRLGLKSIIKCGTLGQGQFGVVERVYLRGVFDEDFALKRISKRQVLELEQQAAVRLEREILSECCHPLIVRLIGTFQDELCVYFLMESLPGGDLFTAIRDIGILNEDHTHFFGACLVLAIEHLHSRGVMYRDLKPENVMLKRNGFLKLVDMGCCSKKARSYTFVGTPEYLAPEVILGKGYDKAVDWWSVGVIMYEMICGPLPFGESTTDLDPLQVMREVLEKPLSIPGKTSSNARELLGGLLERAPEQRLGSSTFHWNNEVRAHPFFGPIQWEAILEQSATPPYMPSSVACNPGSNERAGSAPLDCGLWRPSHALDRSSKDDFAALSNPCELQTSKSSRCGSWDDSSTGGSEGQLANAEAHLPPVPGADLSCFEGF